ncbi:hypothetical protein HDV00_004541 [Rhizophlyctis rosea]|nr:hypothetical protein HDV00_004541 [Rhizophlyctis rosea]
MLDAAVYLDLPELADTCAAIVARNIEGTDIHRDEPTEAGRTDVNIFPAVESLNGLASPLIRTILKRLSISDLCFAEAELLAPTLNCADSSDRPFVDTHSLWDRNYLCFLPQFTPHETSRALILRSHAARQNLVYSCRSRCIQFYIEQLPIDLSDDVGAERLHRLVGTDGDKITSLSLVLDSELQPTWMDLLLNNARTYLSRLKRVEIDLCSSIEEWADLVLLFGETRCTTIVLKVNTPFNATQSEMPLLVADAVTTAVEGGGVDLATRFRHLKIGGERDLSVRAKSQEEVVIPASKSGQGGGGGTSKELIIRCAGGQQGAPLSRQSLTTGLAQCLQSYKLTELDLSDAGLTSLGITHILSFLPTNPVKTLILAKCAVGSIGIAHLFNSLVNIKTSLRTLNISANIGANDTGGPEAARALSTFLSSKTNSTRDLNISHNHFTTVGLLTLCSAIAENTHVDSLDLMGLGLGSTIRHLIDKLNSSNIDPTSTTSKTNSIQNTCTRLTFSQNKLLPRAMTDFLALLASWNPHKQGRSITYLDLSANLFDCTVGQSISHLLQSPSCCLTSLILDGAPHTDFNDEDPTTFRLTDTGAAPIFASLPTSTIKHLSLSHQYITAHSLQTVVPALSTSALENLILKHNQIDDQGVAALQRALKGLWAGGTEGKRIAVDLEGNRVSKRVVGQLKGTMFFVNGHVLYCT